MRANFVNEIACRCYFSSVKWEYQYKLNWDFLCRWRDNPSLIWC